MSRIDRARLDAAAYDFTLDIPIRFDDLDVQGHVNNAAGVVILQEARASFNMAIGLKLLMPGLRTMVAALKVEYAGELHHPGTARTSVGVLAVGRTSFTLCEVVRQNGASRIYAEIVMVVADAGGPAPLPEALREAYTRRLIAPAAAGVPA